MESTFLPDISHIHVDNRSESKKRYPTEPAKNERKAKSKDHWNKFIDEEMERLKNEGTLSGDYDKSKIVQEACERIRKRMKKVKRKKS